MTLIDIWYEVLNRENINWYIYSNNLKLVGQYDGKNSIDEKYNDYIVESATVTDEMAIVILKEDTL